jgi:hypothetical protein
VHHVVELHRSVITVCISRLGGFGPGAVNWVGRSVAIAWARSARRALQARTGARGGPDPGSQGLYELRTLAVLGVVSVLAVVGVGVLTAVGAAQRDTDLADASATAGRLATQQSAVGLDIGLEQGLISLEQDEVQQFQLRLDTGGWQLSSKAAKASQDDLTEVDTDLVQVTASAQVRADASLILQELGFYQGLEATAQADQRQGLPVGAAYLREASSYFTAHILPSADEIRRTDQARLDGDDSAAGGWPLWTGLADAAVIAFLVWVSVVLSRYTRRTFNPGAVAALAVVLVLTVWTVGAQVLEHEQVGHSVAPRAAAAADLAQVRVDAETTDIDDQLTLSDNGEDCSFKTVQLAKPNAQGDSYTYDATCTYEADAEAMLAQGGPLSKDLAAAVTGMRSSQPAQAAQLDGTGAAALAQWLRAEHGLPTLQNLAADATTNLAQGQVPRFDSSFLGTALESSTQASVQKTVSDPFDSLTGAVQVAAAAQWSSYSSGASDAGSSLTGEVVGGLLIGLLGGAAAAAGIGSRVAEYWGRGRSSE